MIFRLGIGAPAYIASVIISLVRVAMGLLSRRRVMFWLILEVSVCSFCGVLAFTEGGGGERVVKYFVVNAFRGAGVLSGLLGEWSGGIRGLDYYFLDFRVLMCLFTKLGLPPFHFWVVGVLRGCTWFSAFLLLTVQKVLPLVFFCYCFEFRLDLVFLTLLSVVAAGLAGLGHHEAYNLLGYSSIVIRGWLVLVSFVRVEVFIVSIFFYVVALFIVLSCLRERGWVKGYPPHSPRRWEILGALLLVVPVGPIYLVKILTWSALRRRGCIVGAWGVALRRALLVPVYIRIIVMLAMKLWKRGVNDSHPNLGFIVPWCLSFGVFIVRGFV